MEVKVAQSCPTLCDPVDCTVHGIIQARILEWGASPFSRGLGVGDNNPWSPRSLTGSTLSRFCTCDDPDRKLLNFSQIPFTLTVWIPVCEDLERRWRSIIYHRGADDFKMDSWHVLYLLGHCDGECQCQFDWAKGCLEGC